MSLCVYKKPLVVSRFVCFSKIDFHRLISEACGRRVSSGSRVRVRRRRRRRLERTARGQHRRQDGQRAASGARAARLGRAEATLGPALHLAQPRRARRRRQARRHIPQGPRHPQQAHAGEVPEAER